ncbi:MAG TPA: carboxymuconolactone decarboxylase family protein [Pyrinomonadaceae bacterium]|jgi:AhpD family alkylhydroperoxidase|nr:carboxymuconolactone decarboxylase family protein [Pyrinomonadaceae bacterium]
MQTRLDYGKAAPGSVQAMYKLQKYADESGLEHSLLELVKMRVSQMNGCAFCIDMHTKDARAAGETEQRLYGLSAWREAPFYTDRERAALAWAEVVTNISQTHASDEEYEAARAQFGEEELVKLTMAIIAINGWNRLSIAFRPEVGTYQPRPREK